MGGVGNSMVDVDGSESSAPLSDPLFIVIGGLLINANTLLCVASAEQFDIL